MDERTENSFDTVDPTEMKHPTSIDSHRGLLSWKYIILGSVILCILIFVSIGIGLSVKGMSDMYLTGIKETIQTESPQNSDKSSMNIVQENEKSTTAVTASPTIPALKSSNGTPVNSSQVSKMKNYCSLLSSYISSAESARGEVSEEDLNRLLDSYNRQKVFCDTLLSRIGDKNTITSEDDAMWESISKLSYESSDLFYKIFGR